MNVIPIYAAMQILKDSQLSAKTVMITIAVAVLISGAFIGYLQFFL